MTQEEAVARRIERLVDGQWEAVRTCERAEGRDPWLEARLVHTEARQNWGRDNVQVIEVFRAMSFETHTRRGRFVWKPAENSGRFAVSILQSRPRWKTN